jgi:predicted RNA binding protein YcfA (HicA-like mRNA interferase family)
MSQWPSCKAKRVLAALLRIGWQMKRQSGSHRTLSREGWPDVVFAFHDQEEIGPRMLTRIAKHTGLKPEDL